MLVRRCAGREGWSSEKAGSADNLSMGIDRISDTARITVQCSQVVNHAIRGPSHGEQTLIALIGDIPNNYTAVVDPLSVTVGPSESTSACFEKVDHPYSAIPKVRM